MRLSALVIPLVVVLSGAGVQAKATKRKAATQPSATRSKKSKKARPPALALTSTVAKPRETVDEEPAPKPKQSKGKALKVGKTSKTRKSKKVAPPEPDRWPAIHLEAVNTKEKLTLRVYDRKGKMLRSSVRKLWHFMRCHLTGKEHPIHWRLIRNMYKIARRYQGKTMYVYSGFRSRKVAALRSSNHVKGRAVDFRIAGVSNKALRDYLMNNFKPAGVGYYPNAPFVHFDVREKQSAFWVDYSGKGESAEYASDSYAVLKAEKNAKAKPATPPHKPAPAAAAPAPGADEPDEKEAPEAKPAAKPRPAAKVEEPAEEPPAPASQPAD
jgi:uncharacterized protein YcbK (DUF882 family)